MTDLLDRVRTALAGRYTIEHELDRGTDTTVYLAEDTDRHRQVTIEVVERRGVAPAANDPTSATPAGAERNPPHPFPLLECAESDGLLLYVRPFVRVECSDSHSAGPDQAPHELSELLSAVTEADENQAWDAFLSAFGHLLLKTARYTHRGPDSSMDAYAFILEKLRHNGFQRLRKFSGGDEEALSRWLVVVARRLCSDFRRHRHPSLPVFQ